MTHPNYSQRQARLADELAKHDFHSLLLNPGPSLAYLTGMHFHLSSRPIAAFFPQKHPVFLVLPELEAPKAKDLAFEYKLYTFGEHPSAWLSAFRQAISAADLSSPERIGVEPRRMRYLELALFQEAYPAGKIEAAAEVISAIRAQKDSDEIAAMRQAVVIAEQALQATIPVIHAGVMEKEIAAELTIQLFRHGSEPELAFFPIVSGGPNGANPHATPGERRLQNGDLLVIDWGATYHGYNSDITRTFAIGQVDPELTYVSQVVVEANQAGRSAAGPGVSASAVDIATRQVIEKAGYGEYFIHRTGHGIGLEGHEEPYIRNDNHLPLLPGMTFTVEPGIYLPNRAGVRIEDDLVITELGSDTLTTLPRGLFQIPE